MRATGGGNVQRAEPFVGLGVVAQGTTAPAGMAPRLRPASSCNGGIFFFPIFFSNTAHFFSFLVWGKSEKFLSCRRGAILGVDFDLI